MQRGLPYSGWGIVLLSFGIIYISTVCHRQSLRHGYAAPPPFTQGRLWLFDCYAVPHSFTRRLYKEMKCRAISPPTRSLRLRRTLSLWSRAVDLIWGHFKRLELRGIPHKRWEPFCFLLHGSPLCRETFCSAFSTVCPAPWQRRK